MNDSGSGGVFMNQEVSCVMKGRSKDVLVIQVNR